MIETDSLETAKLAIESMMYHNIRNALAGGGDPAPHVYFIGDSVGTKMKSIDVLKMFRVCCDRCSGFKWLRE